MTDSRAGSPSFQRQSDETWIGLAVFDVVSAGHRIGHIVHLKQREIMIQRRPLAIRRKCDRAAAPGQRLEHLAHTGERLHAREVLPFVELASFLPQSNM